MPFSRHSFVRFASIVAVAMTAASSLVARQTAQPAAQATAQAEAPEYGPAKGTLVIVGGGGTDGTGIMEKFIQLAGGPDANFVIVPTAGGNKNQDGTIREYKEENEIRSWLARGGKNG